MSTTGYSEQELASLTPDERSALESESATDDDAAVLAEIAAEGDTDAAAAAVAAQAEVDQQAVADAAANLQDDGKKAEAEKADDAGQKDEPIAIQTDKTFHAEAPADIAEKRKNLRAEDAAALKKLMDGEIEAEEYAAIKDRVSDDLEALVRSEVTADVSTRMAVQAKANEWAKALNSAVASAKAEGLDYMSKELSGEFDSLLKVYSEKASQQGMTDDNLEASKWALAEANKMMRRMHGTPVKASVADDKKSDEPAAARHNLTTLAKMPAADRAPINDDVMAKMGSLQGEDLEKYMATLSSKEIDRIMAGV
jgi:hypothetical protein